MDTISKVSQLSLQQGLGSRNAFVIKLSNSKFDHFAASDLLAKIESWVAANMMMSSQDVPILIVDMENISFIDSDGLQKLVAALRIMKSQNSNLLLCAQQPSVRLVFEISGLDKLFAIFPDTHTSVLDVHPNQSVLVPSLSL
jgi:anti-anti-sigma factor